MCKKLFLMIVALLTVGATVAIAQVTTATVSGTVTDSSGAVLPGAKITLTNEGTGLTRDVMTDAAGHYNAPLLPVGNYKVEATMQGFQTEDRTGLNLAVGQLAVIDLKLQVGAVSQSVEVTGEAPLVQTTEATVSYLTPEATLRDIPLNDRDMSQLVDLNPGVTDTETAGNSAFNGYGRRLSISGARGEDNTFLLDGGMIGDFRRHIPAGPSGALLGIENTQEFQVLTNSFSAQYGRSLGGVFNAVSKSGTNQFHGDVYEFLRNDDLDANPWEANSFSLGVKAPFRRNQFGGTIGGPIKKDKVFFFVGFEGTRESLGINEVENVLDNNARNGIFPTESGGTVKVISPLMQPYINMYPFATPGAQNNGDGTQNYLWTYKQPTSENYGQARVDFPSLTTNDSAFFRYTSSNSTRNIAATTSTFPGYLQISSLGSDLMTLSETHVFSPTLLSSMRFHFNRVVPSDLQSEPPLCSADASLPDCVPSGIQFVPGQEANPMITPGAFVGGSGNAISPIGGGGYSTAPTIMISNRFTWQDDINWTKGEHSIVFGGQLERFQDNSAKFNRQFGTWTWSSAQNFLSGTCNNLATNLVPTSSFPTTCGGANGTNPILTTEQSYRGAPVSSALSTVQSVLNLCCGGTAPNGFDTYNRSFRNWDFGFYIQDDWRVKPNLTLNIGIRWEPYTVYTENHGFIANIENIFNNNVATVGGQFWQNKSWRDFSPRLGFAWDPTGSGKTSIRGGGSLLYEPNDPNEFYNQADRTPPLAFDFSINGSGNFPNALSEIGQSPTLGPGYAVNFQNNKDPHMLQYNFSIQQQFGAENLVSLGYTGSRGFDLVGLAEYNTPFAVYDGIALAVPATTVAQGYLNPGVGTVNTNYSDLNFFGPSYNSWYNSLQATFLHRFSKGFQTQVSYTYSKNMSDSDTSQVANQVNTGYPGGLYPWERSADISTSGYNIPQTLKINYSYDLPTGKAFSKGAMAKVLGGWQTTGIWTIHSGHPVTLAASIPTALNNIRVLDRTVNDNPNFTGSPILGSPDNNGGLAVCPAGLTCNSSGEVCPSASTCFSPYFNTAAYVFAPCVQGNGTSASNQVVNPALPLGAIGTNCLGTDELGNAGRNSLYGPGFVEWDPALLKNVALTEATKLQFRLELFNVLNRPNFQVPAVSLVGATGLPTQTAGKISATAPNTPREMQLSLKLIW